jgi:hypothetical protein
VFITYILGLQLLHQWNNWKINIQTARQGYQRAVPRNSIHCVEFAFSRCVSETLSGRRSSFGNRFPYAVFRTTLLSRLYRTVGGEYLQFFFFLRSVFISTTKRAFTNRPVLHNTIVLSPVRDHRFSLSPFSRFKRYSA